jgi:outer membrane protein assembly factor BamB
MPAGPSRRPGSLPPSIRAVTGNFTMQKFQTNAFVTVPLLWSLFSLLVRMDASAGDWPQFLGPTRDGVYAGGDLATSWPKEGPPIVWQQKVGAGFSGPVVASGRLVLFHRDGNNAVIEAMDARTGKGVWRFEYPTDYSDDFGFDPGPRATPAIADGKVFTYGAEGLIHAVDFKTGKKLWSVDAVARFNSGKGFFGRACSPLVEGSAVLLNIGGSDGAGIIALDKDTGKLLWKASGEEASYSSPTVASFGGKRRALFFTRSNLTSLDPANGRIDFEFPWKPAISASVSAAVPLVIGDQVFISASYQAGAALLRVRDAATETVWSGDDILSNQYATSVHRDGFLYGVEGRVDHAPGGSLRCVELKTGKVRWNSDALGAPLVTLAGDQLLVLTDKGMLMIAPASTEDFKPVSRAQVLSFLVRAHPAIADGFFYARSKDRLVCVDLRKSSAR